MPNPKNYSNNRMAQDKALEIIGAVAAWMQIEGFLSNDEKPNWKLLEKTLIDILMAD